MYVFFFFNIKLGAAFQSVVPNVRPSVKVFFKKPFTAPKLNSKLNFALDTRLKTHHHTPKVMTHQTQPVVYRQLQLCCCYVTAALFCLCSIRSAASAPVCLPLVKLLNHWMKPSALSEWLVSLGDGVM